MKKKIISIILCICLLATSLCAFGLNASAAGGSRYTLSSGLKALRSQFTFGMASNGMDYDYFSPVKSAADETKYPIVVWLHGLFSGAVPGLQVNNNDIAYWTSKEFQARFPKGGAFILLPRSKESVDLWNDSMADDLKFCIDYFITRHAQNVDTTRIYIGGLSTGGKMSYRMCAEYPEMFAAAFPCSPTYALTSNDCRKLANTPVWLLASSTDIYVNYAVTTVPSWKKLVNESNRASDCRLATFTGLNMYYPDGSRVDYSHDTWYAATYDMFTEKNQPYFYMEVVDGNGNRVNLTYPNGMISWLSKYRSTYQGLAVNTASSVSTVISSILYAVINYVVITLGIKGVA